MVAGGDYAGPSVEFLDLDTLTWAPKQSLPHDLRLAESVPFQDSFLIVGGDMDYNTGDSLDTIYYYNPAEDSWDLMDQKLSVPGGPSAAFMVPDSFAGCL